jgi:hypothetical protein
VTQGLHAGREGAIDAGCRIQFLEARAYLASIGVIGVPESVANVLGRNTAGIRVAPALVSHHFLLRGGLIDDQTINDILDHVVLPLMRP